MQKFLPFVIILFAFSGCTTTPKGKLAKVSVDQEPIQQQTLPSDTSPELQNIADEDLAAYVEKNGIVFAKTDFQGVLKARFVKLHIEDVDDASRQFQLHIGEKLDEQKLPWDVKNIEPGYFFVELPKGDYKISSVSIPVGSTLATEAVDIRFTVLPDEITYIGTLKMVGTKEKIKLGGVPLLKPGFEYEVEIIDEREEGVTAFRHRYPTVPNDILFNIMQLNSS